MIKYLGFGIQPYEGGYEVGKLKVRKSKKNGEPEVYTRDKVYPSSGQAVVRYIQRQVRTEKGATSPGDIQKINEQVASDLRGLVDGEL